VKVRGRDRISASELLGPILRSVSRSFYISIRLLPRELRKPVGLAYLLARTTDTVADAAEISPMIRAEALSTLRAVINGKVSQDVIINLIASFLPLKQNQSERRLIESLPDCLALLDRLSAEDRGDIRGLLEKITKGQELDVARFGDLTHPQALATDRELHEYTYLVAGCVGEFWTELCFRHVRNFADLLEAEMSDLGKRYGNGLQLINILRDAYSDLHSGRCYFPMQELQEVGLEPSEILLEPARLVFILKKWREEAQRGLTAGMRYVHAIRNRRLRGATALPALIGARTLSLLRAAGPAELHRTIKVPRREVRAIVTRVAVSAAGRESLNQIFLRGLE
jgi:farnesyl-diphosphate farnesyltransferase